MTTQADISRSFVESLACRPESDWLIGAEWELFGYCAGTLERLPPAAVSATLEAYTRGDRMERSMPVAASTGAGWMSVEPGGQIEYSTLPHRSLSNLEQELTSYVTAVREIAGPMGICLVGLGFDP